MGGREGLVDTAVKTADKGYMSRRLMKALEDLSVQYDNTVRNASGCIVQFMYGGDGMDPAQMEAKDGSPLNFRRLFMKVKATCPSLDQESLTNEEISEILEDITNKWLLNSNMTLEGVYPSATAYRDESLMRFAVSLAKFLGKPFAVSLAKFLGMNSDENKPSTKDCSDTGSGTPNIVEITRPQLQVFIDTCFSRYLSKKVECGTAIGAIGAQSIGEPGTQMTLKTFHFAGVASMNVTLGVPRIKEIINAAKKIATPVIEAKLASGYDNPIRARMLKGCIEKTVLQQVAKSVKASQASRQASIVITLDMKMIQKAQLSIDAYTVKESVLRTPRIKLKEQQVKVLNPRKLEVVLQADKSKLQFELHGFKNKLSQVVVKGLNSVERAVIHEHEEKLRLIVEGTGFLSVMGIEGIDWRNTESNHIIEVQQTLGIEAARKKIIKEIQYTMKEHGMTIDIRHMMLLADLMTFKGEVLGITRHGLQKMKDSVLMLASFEQTADHLFHASVNGRLDRIEGVSECIIMGIPMPLGTGMLKVRQRVQPVEFVYGSDPIIC